MNAQLAHPSKAELSAFALGKLPNESSATIEHHLAECDACSATLASVADDTLIGLLVEGQDVSTGDDAWIDVPLDDPAETAAHTGTIAGGVPTELADHPRYRVLRLLGRGGMGDVYLAEHRLMERPVAIKVMKRRFLGRPDGVERFHREVKAAAQLKHENIVTAYDAEQAGDLHLLVMEYVDGRDLATEVKQRGPLPVHQACDYIRQAALGLAHAHAQGMVHRDIKPHNLMLVDGQVRILDFGLAHVVQAAAEEPHGVADDEASSLTGVHSVLGTPDYISPEQIQNAHAADHRSDLYSLGATLFFLLTGRPPFSEGSATERIESHLRRDPADVRETRADVPEEVAHVIRRLMAKVPSQRYPTAESVAAELSPFCGEPAAASRAPAPAGGRYWNWVIAPLFAALFAGGAWGFWQIIITIRDRDKNIIAQANVPDGPFTVEVTEASAEEPATAEDEIARQANAFLQAAFKGDAAAISTYMKPGYDGQLDDFRELGLERLAIERVWADAEAALAISQPVTVENPGGKQEGRLVITLENQGGTWLVGDVDFEMDSSLEEVKRFRDAHPNASERTRRADSAPGHPSAHPGHPQPGAHPASAPGELLGRHQGPAYDVAFSRDGKCVASAGSDEAIRVWDVATGRELARFDRHRLTGRRRRSSPGRGTVSVVFTPDGQHVLSGGWDGMARLWEVATGNEIAQFGPHSNVASAVDVSPDGKYAATAYSNWEESTNSDLNQARIWDLQTGELLHTLIGHEHGLTDVSFSPDGGRLATSSPDATVRIWDVETGEELQVLQHVTKVHEVRFSPDGRTIAAGCGGMLVTDGKINDPDATVVVLWDAESGKQLRKFRGHAGSIRSIDYSPDGRYIVSASGLDHLNSQTIPSVEYSIRVWDVETGDELLHFASFAPLHRVRFSPDGRQILSCDEHSAVRLWQLPEKLVGTPEAEPADAEQGKLPIRFGITDDPITKADDLFPPDGDWAFKVDGDRYVRLFEVDEPGVEDCMLIYRAKLRTEDVGRSYLEMWVRMPDGREAFSKGLDRPIHGTTGWASYQVPFFLKKGERPDLVKLGVTVEGGGTIWVEDVELLAKSPAEPGTEETAELEDPTGPAPAPEHGALRTREGFYLRAVLGGGNELRADAPEPKTSEVFALEWLDASQTKVRLRTREGHYVHAALGGGEDVDAERRQAGSSEVFHVEWVDREAGKLRLRTREGYYVHPVGGGGGDVDAREREPGSSEVLTLVPVEELDTSSERP